MERQSESAAVGDLVTLGDLSDLCEFLSKLLRLAHPPPLDNPHVVSCADRSWPTTSDAAGDDADQAQGVSSETTEKIGSTTGIDTVSDLSRTTSTVVPVASPDRALTLWVPHRKPDEQLYDGQQQSYGQYRPSDSGNQPHLSKYSAPVAKASSKKKLETLSDGESTPHNVPLPMPTPVVEAPSEWPLEDNSYGPYQTSTAAPQHMPLSLPAQVNGRDKPCAPPQLKLSIPSDPHNGGTAPKRFNDEAMRVLQSCEQMLTDYSFQNANLDDDDDCDAFQVSRAERDHVLREIAGLKKRYVRPTELSRCSISRHRRYSLGVEARRVLKGWVDEHIEDPYPSLSEKQDLAMAAHLSIKQVNDVSEGDVEPGPRDG